MSLQQTHHYKNQLVRISLLAGIILIISLVLRNQMAGATEAIRCKSYALRPGNNLTKSDLSNCDFGLANLSNANLHSATLTNATLTGVVSGSITGTPSSLPTNWKLTSGYLIGPGVNLTNATLNDVHSGGIIGTPFALASGWQLISGVLTYSP